MARGCTQALRLAGISIGRQVSRTFNAAKFAASVRSFGHTVRLGSDVNVQNPHLILCGSDVSIGDDAELFATLSDESKAVSIEIGHKVKIGKRCQLAANPGHIRIGDHASLHSNVVLLGWIDVGRYSLLSANIFASSGNHRAFDSPELLIRDQDLIATRKGREIKPVIIEEDCWIGWSAAIMSGVHIGRGAVVGANAVVTKDIEPYEVVGGQPARRLKKRLMFSPEVQIIAEKPEHGPYLYRGFLQLQEERQETAKKYPGHVSVLDRAVIVLNGEPGFTRLLLRGMTLMQEVSLYIRLEGRECSIKLPEKAEAPFELELLLSDFLQTVDDLDGHECRIPEGRVFHLSTQYPKKATRKFTDASAVWALHSASLLH
jgi:acetyltransferase-like isoleucine patch superfamily enzyme